MIETPPAVTEILAAMERAEPVDEAYSEQDVLEEMTAPGVDLERTSIGIVDDDRLVAFGWLRVSPPSPAWKVFAVGWGAPGLRRPGNRPAARAGARVKPQPCGTRMRPACPVS